MRKKTQYFHYTIGSLLDGLSIDERQDISVLVLIVNTAPQVHYAYDQWWLEQIADTVFEYNQTTAGYDYLVELEGNNNYWVKSLLDYTFILERCADTGAPYVLIVEDDFLAYDRWYRRLREAFEAPDLKGSDWYLRLFFAEEFLGWQSQRAPVYFAWSAVSTGVVSGLALMLRSLIQPLQRNWSRQTVLLYCVTACAMMIALAFAAGRLSVFPLNKGIVEMEYGCCGQSLMFPREIVPRLADWFRRVRDGHADRRIEEFAEHANLAPLALVPSVFQHIGGETSHEADLPQDIQRGMSLAQRVWSFGFEQLNSAY